MRRKSSRNDDRWPAYVPVAERQRLAAADVRKLAKQGHAPQPLVIAGTTIASTVWGDAWCRNIEGYADDGGRLQRGRSYARSGAIVDLSIETGMVRARVRGSTLYRTRVDLEPVAAARWQAICADCRGGIGTLVELLEGRLAERVMARICREQDGLFPTPREIGFDCDCPDPASMCKHVAAVLYGIGTRLDMEPQLLFRLRGVDASLLVAGLDEALAAPPPTKPRPGRLLSLDAAAALFGLDLDTEPTGRRPKAHGQSVLTAGPPAGGGWAGNQAERGRSDQYARSSKKRPS